MANFIPAVASSISVTNLDFNYGAVTSEFI